MKPEPGQDEETERIPLEVVAAWRGQSVAELLDELEEISTDGGMPEDVG